MKYRNTEKIDWHKFYVSKEYIDMDKEQEIVSSHASVQIKKDKDKYMDNLKIWIAVGVVAAILLALVIKFK